MCVSFWLRTVYRTFLLSVFASVRSHSKYKTWHVGSSLLRKIFEISAGFVVSFQNVSNTGMQCVRTSFSWETQASEWMSLQHSPYRISYKRLWRWSSLSSCILLFFACRERALTDSHLGFGSILGRKRESCMRGQEVGKNKRCRRLIFATPYLMHW